MAKGLLSVLDPPVDTKVVDRNGNVRTFPFGRTPVMFSYNPALDVAFTHGRIPGVNGHNYEPVLVYH